MEPSRCSPTTVTLCWVLIAFEGRLFVTVALVATLMAEAAAKEAAWAGSAGICEACRSSFLFGWSE